MGPEQTERRMKMTKQRQRKVTQDTLRILTLWWHIIIGWLYSTLVRNISHQLSSLIISFVRVFAYSCLLCLFFSFASLTSSLPCSGKLLRIRLLALMLLSPRGFGDIFSSPFGLFQILMPYSLSDLFNYGTCNVLFFKYPHLLRSFLTFPRSQKQLQSKLSLDISFSYQLGHT